MDNAHQRRDDSATIWDRVLASVRTLVTPGNFDTWFAPTREHRRTGDTLEVTVPNDMFAEWMRHRFLPTIQTAIAEAGLDGTRVEFVTPDAVPGPRTASGRPGAEKLGGSDRQETPARHALRLNPRYTFNNFVVSSCNQFAHAAALAVSDQPGRTYNPLFLHGGVGLGKTHLMQAIGNRLSTARSDVTIVYQTSEAFMNELITAIRYEETPRFRERYRSVDVLLIDDVQFLAGKESTQEEFFHTFNALYDSGRQIVLTSDCPPRKIPQLEERLRSRFEWGLITDVSPPDLETKMAILNKMAASNGWDLPSEVSYFIAEKIRSNIRELEGCLTTLMAAASLERRPPDLALARSVVGSLVSVEEHTVTIDAIVRAVAKEFDLKVSELKADTNARRITHPRQIAMYLAKNLAGESLPSIGAYFGGKHHTTVLHAERKIKDLRAKDSGVDAKLRRLEGLLQ